MIVVDIGNTDTVIGFYKNQKLNNIFRLKTKKNNFKQKLSNYFIKKKTTISKIDYKICIISSVVPQIDRIFFTLLKIHNFKTFNININKIKKDIFFRYISRQLGADRIANTCGAIKKYGKNLIIIDFGTATTFDVIKNNIYEGGIIAPGIDLSHQSLVAKASKLKKISIKKTITVVGNNTKESMQSGFYWGYVGLINKIIEKILLEKNFKPKIILTGGLVNVFKNELNFLSYCEPNLTLQGLYHIGIKYYA